MKLQLYTDDGELGWETECCCIISGVQALADQLEANDPDSEVPLPTDTLRDCHSLVAAQQWVRDNLDGGVLKALPSPTRRAS